MAPSIEERENSIAARHRRAVGPAELVKRASGSVVVHVLGGPFKWDRRREVLGKRFDVEGPALVDLLWYMDCSIKRNRKPKKSRWSTHDHAGGWM